MIHNHFLVNMNHNQLHVLAYVLDLYDGDDLDHHQVQHHILHHPWNNFHHNGRDNDLDQSDDAHNVDDHVYATEDHYDGFDMNGHEKVYPCYIDARNDGGHDYAQRQMYAQQSRIPGQQSGLQTDTEHSDKLDFLYIY